LSPFGALGETRLASEAGLTSPCWRHRATCSARSPRSLYAEICSRPLALRRARIRLPPRVRIRMRKPWVFLRLRLLGWYVRFTLVPRIDDLWRVTDLRR
jgi:hypothetical protein